MLYQLLEHTLFLYDYQPEQSDGAAGYEQLAILDAERVKGIHTDVDLIYMFVGKTGTAQGFEDYSTFIDINEKAQLLDVEDIFKGHCFEIFSPEFYSNLRDTWVNLKKCAVGFKKFGIKTLGDYIYLFLLEVQVISPLYYQPRKFFLLLLLNLPLLIYLFF